MVRRMRKPGDYNPGVNGGPAVQWNRPEPPEDLEPGERAIWREVIGRLPADWFTVECQPVLKQLCRHIRYADDLAGDMAAIRAIMTEIKQDSSGSMTVADRMKTFAKMSGELHNLMRIHIRQSHQIGMLSTRLRLTPQSRYEALRANDETKTARPPGAQPWNDWPDGEQPSTTQ